MEFKKLPVSGTSEKGRNGAHKKLHSAGQGRENC